MLVTFRETRLVSEDGHRLKRCEAGQTYDLAELAACLAIRRGWAVYAGEAA